MTRLRHVVAAGIAAATLVLGACSSEPDQDSTDNNATLGDDATIREISIDVGAASAIPDSFVINAFIDEFEFELAPLRICLSL